MDTTNGIGHLSLESSSLNALPLEIQDLVLHHLLHDASYVQLKRLRGFNRYFRDRVDLHLFKTVHISASDLSLNRARHISENDRINGYVRELVFHRGTFSGHKAIRYSGLHGLRPRDYDNFEEYMLRGQPGFRPSQADIMRVSQCYAAFVEEVQAEGNFNRDASWGAALRITCSRFTRLEKLVTLSDEEDLESEYLKRRCGLTHQSWTPNYFAPYEILDPCGPQFQPTALTLDSVIGEDFASAITSTSGGEAGIKHRFAKLRNLRLGFSETGSTLGVAGSYDVFVAACPNLRSLFLNFRSFLSSRTLKDPNSFPQALMRLVLAQDFKYLSDLDLSYAMMTEADFVGFLARHQDVLSTITLSSWPMPVTPGLDPQPTGSIIRALYRIGQLPLRNLKCLTLASTLCNRPNGEGWEIDSDPDYSRPKNPWPILPMLNDYLHNRGTNTYEFPFPVTVQNMENAKTGPELAELDRLPFKLGCSDATFQWYEEDALQHP